MATLVSSLIGFIVGQESYYITEQDQYNISRNSLTKEELKKSYELLYKKWLDDINKENEKIKQLNKEIEERNKLIPKASVRYE